MSQRALTEGTIAFKLGMPRSSNPHHPASEDWMCWRDGYDQARAVAERPASIEEWMKVAGSIKVA